MHCSAASLIGRPYLTGIASRQRARGGVFLARSPAPAPSCCLSIFPIPLRARWKPTATASTTAFAGISVPASLAVRLHAHLGCDGPGISNGLVIANLVTAREAIEVAGQHGVAVKIKQAALLRE